MWFTRVLLTLIFGSLFLQGCASTLDERTYSRNEVRRVQWVQFGVVEAVSPVTIEGRRSGVGSLPGALIGGIAGSDVGGGKGKAISTVVGAVIGGIAGQALEEQATRAQGLEITVRMDHGGFISVVQEVSQEGALRVGDRVRLLRNGDSTRVAYWPYQNYAPDHLQ